MQPFEHIALDKLTPKPLVYTAMSKHYFYYRMYISKYVLEQWWVPLNPFMIFDYFLLDMVDRDLVREWNNNIVVRANEIRVFWPISNGVLSEIFIAKQYEKIIKYFVIEKPHRIIQVGKAEVTMEEDVLPYKSQL